MLTSLGKDSSVLMHLAIKAFHPAPPPFPLLHVDTTWKFRAMYEFRDQVPAARPDMELLVHTTTRRVLAMGVSPFHPRVGRPHGHHEDPGPSNRPSRSTSSTPPSAAPGETRRSRGPRSASSRSAPPSTAGIPRTNGPSSGTSITLASTAGSGIRAFPLSDWTELDVWQYIYLENIPVVSLYFAKERPVVERDGQLILVDDERMPPRPGEQPVMRSVRFRTLGCYPLTGAVESEADTLPAIIEEMLSHPAPPSARGA